MVDDSIMVHFYRVLGRTFYALAKSDKTVREEELEAMKKAVKDNWLDLEDTYDHFHSDSAYQIEIVFD